MPKAFSAASKARVMAARSVTSASIAIALPPVAFDFVLERLEPVGPPRHQRDRGAVIGQRPGELHAEPAGRAGHQRHAAFQAEHLGGFHAEAVIHGGRNDME